jgi:hypothetical protein
MYYNKNNFLNLKPFQINENINNNKKKTAEDFPAVNILIMHSLSSFDPSEPGRQAQDVSYLSSSIFFVSEKPCPELVEGLPARRV